MILSEWIKKYGIKSARLWFGTSSHLVFAVTPNKYVVGRCGRWISSQPLGNGEDIETQKQVIRDSLLNSFDTEETIS